MDVKKDPAFLFYSKDFFSMIAGLTMEERGQFITFITIQHQQGHLSEKKIGISVGILSADVWALLTKDSAGLWFNEWLENLIEERKSFTTSQRERANKRWEKERAKGQTVPHEHATAPAAAQPAQLPTANADANANANAVVNTTTKKLRKKNVSVPLDDTTFPTFSDFWEAGLAKVGKEIAMRYWYKLAQADREEIMIFIPRYLQSNELQYLKRPPAFLNQKTWKDEIIDRTGAKRIAAAIRANTNSAAVLDQNREYRADF